MRLYQQVISVASGVSQVASRHLFSRIHLCKVSPAVTVHPDKTWIRCVLRTFFVGMQSVGFGVASGSSQFSSRLSDRMSDSSNTYQLASGRQTSAPLELRLIGSTYQSTHTQHNKQLLSDSRSVRSFAHGFAIIAQTLSLHVCRKAGR